MLYSAYMPLPTAKLEQEYMARGFRAVAGLDEAGKGAWAGPVVAGSVILPENVDLPGLDDSKRLNAKQREELYARIVEQAIAWGIGLREAADIDEVGLAEAHRQAMQEAVDALTPRPDFLLVDGLGIRKLGVQAECIIKGDQKVRCIAAASIIAKVTRDRLMIQYAQEFGDYGFDEHKGYGTEQHQSALTKFGVCSLHRLSYEPVYRGWQKSLFA